MRLSSLLMNRLLAGLLKPSLWTRFGNGDKQRYLLAVQKDRVVGHILISSLIESDKGTHSAVGLAPMAVLPALQRQGVGSMLVNSGLEECRQARHERTLVLGYAEDYYRFGFIPASRYGVRCEYAVPDDVFMALELREWTSQGKAGTAKYQPEFNEVQEYIVRSPKAKGSDIRLPLAVNAVDRVSRAYPTP